jgi:hypothetical protein
VTAGLRPSEHKGLQTWLGSRGQRGQDVITASGTGTLSVKNRTLLYILDVENSRSLSKGLESPGMFHRGVLGSLHSKGPEHRTD